MAILVHSVSFLNLSTSVPHGKQKKAILQQWLLHRNAHYTSTCASACATSLPHLMTDSHKLMKVYALRKNHGKNINKWEKIRTIIVALSSVKERVETDIRHIYSKSVCAPELSRNDSPKQLVAVCPVRCCMYVNKFSSERREPSAPCGELLYCDCRE